MDIRQVNLNLLVALNALLAHRNVTRAALEVGLTQSAMSGELRRLRALFHDELLVRSGREYLLTPLATELVEPVADLILSIEQTLSRRLSFDPATDERSFSIAMSDYAMMVLIEPLLQRICRCAPGISLHVHPLESADLSTMLRPGGMDLVITVQPERASDICHAPLFSDRYVCIVSAEHPYVGDSMPLDLFQTLPRLQWGLGTVLISSTAEQHLKELGGRVQLTTESFALAPFLLRNTDLVAVLQERLAHRFASAAGVKVLPLPIAVPDLTEFMYWSPVADTDPGHGWLRSTIAEIAQDL
jgi:LysR family transcriptional regulator, nod-box dependent transcriptional activator